MLSSKLYLHTRGMKTDVPKSISYTEASRTSPDGKHVHEDFIKEAADWAQKAVNEPDAGGDSMEALAVEYLVSLPAFCTWN